MATAFNQPLAVFTSYSHVDSELRAELHQHLLPLIRRRIIVDWHDRLIVAGDAWRNSIEAQLETAHIVLLLVSKDFLASHYCYEIEMKRALERAEAEGIRIVPVLLRETYWQEEPFSRFQVLPRNGHAICSAHWANRDAAMLEVVQGLRALAAELLGEPIAENVGAPPLKARLSVPLELPVDLERFTADYRDHLLEVLVSMLRLEGSVHVVAVRRGSTIVTLELDDTDAKRLIEGVRSGLLDEAFPGLRLSYVGANHGVATHRSNAAVAQADEGELEQDLAAAANGGHEERNRLWERHYDRLRTCASQWLVVQGRKSPVELDEDDLVTLAYSRLIDRTSAMENGSKYFFRAFYTECMRIVVDHWRKLQDDKKRGHHPLDDMQAEFLRDQRFAGDYHRIFDVLAELERQDARVAQVAMLKVLENRPYEKEPGGKRGLTNAEVADLLGLALRTVDRDWAFAKSYLLSKLGRQE